MKKLAVVSLLVMGAVAARAQDRPDRYADALRNIEQAKAAIARKDSGRAIAALRRAILDLGGLESYLPVVEGWKRDKPSVESGEAKDNKGNYLGRWTAAWADYVGPDGKKLTVTIMAAAEAAKAQHKHIEALAEADAALKFAKQGKHESDSEFSTDNGWTIMLARFKARGGKRGVQMVGVYKDLIVRVQTDQAPAEAVKAVFGKIDRVGLGRTRE
jgi:hypothetical protein